MYKTETSVLNTHQHVRQFRNSSLAYRIHAMQHKNTLGNGPDDHLDLRPWRGATLRQRSAWSGKEALMELRTRLNVLAAIISFAFLTAVVFGMF